MGGNRAPCVGGGAGRWTYDFYVGREEAGGYFEELGSVEALERERVTKL